LCGAFPADPGGEVDHGALLRAAERGRLRGGAKRDHARRSSIKDLVSEGFQRIQGHGAGGVERGDQGHVQAGERHGSSVYRPDRQGLVQLCTQTRKLR
jgi:hypothetical protein